MNELIIELTDITPKEFFGTHDNNIELIKTYFPKIKIVARGTKIIAIGDGELLVEFEKRMEMLLDQFQKFNKLDDNIIERVLSSQSTDDFESSKASGNILVHGVNGRKIKAQTTNQRRLVDSVNKNDMVFAIGPAGTGKTYTGVALAVKALKNKEVKRIILTRPAVEAGENLGFLPGDLKEKLDPYMQPLYDALKEMIPHEKLKSYIEKEIIQIAPLAFMRGRTLDNAFVILDEAQNTSHSQMKMFLTRMGTNAKFLITGDPGQIDLPRKLASGLKEALSILNKVKGIAIITLNDKDIIRNKIVKKVIEAYNKIES